MSRKVKYSKEIKIQVYQVYQKGNGSFINYEKSIGDDYVADYRCGRISIVRNKDTL